MNLAQLTKRQMDAKLRQMRWDPNKNTIISDDGAEGVEVVDPNAKVTTVNSVDGAVTIVAGDNITVTPSGQTITIAAAGDALSKYEESFSAEDPWTVTHNLGAYPAVTVWEETTAESGFGTQAFGTSYFGGAAAICTENTDGPTITQQGLNETVVTWGSNKSGKVVCIG